MFYLLNLSLPFCILLSSIMMILSVNSWFTAWMALELNMMAFLPMLISPNKLSSEAALKYFFIQVVGSILVFFFMIMSYFYSSIFNLYSQWSPFIILLYFALFLKLGAVPFHFWFPATIEGLSWNNSLLLMTLQKLGPLSLVMMISPKINMMPLFCGTLSSFVGGVSGINQLMCRKIMSYSSIAHLGWILCASALSKTLIMVYFMIYMLMTTIIVFLFKMYNSFHMNQLFLFHNMLVSTTLIFYLSLLSLGGLPPFLGFLPKWLVVKFSTMGTMVILVLILSSVITLYFYLRMTYTSFMILYTKPSTHSTPQNPFFLKWMITLPLTLLPLGCLMA